MGEAQKQTAVFFTLIAFIILTFAVLLAFDLFTPVAILLVILVILIAVYSQTSTFFAQVDEFERVVVFRKGVFKEVAGPGWIFFIPFIESYKLIDLRTKTYDIPAQEVVTNDNIKLQFDAILYLKVTDPKKAILNIGDYKHASVTAIQGALRSVVGNLQLADVISNVGEITEELKKATTEVSGDWGVNIENVEIQSIVLPKEVQQAMHQLKQAEQKKLAAKEVAEGKRITIEAIQEAAGKLTDPTLQYLYLQSLEKIAEGKSSKIIFPLELSSLASRIAGSFGSFEQAQDKVSEDYEKLSKEGINQKKIIKQLKEEYGIEEKKAKKWGASK